MTITYRAYIIDAYEREQDRWRATIRRQDGMRIWVAVPRSEHESVTTSADTLTAEGAIDLAIGGQYESRLRPVFGRACLQLGKTLCDLAGRTDREVNVVRLKDAA
jgi:hypothetical protein